jgi:hypothetical protein
MSLKLKCLEFVHDTRVLTLSNNFILFFRVQMPVSFSTTYKLFKRGMYIKIYVETKID